MKSQEYSINTSYKEKYLLAEHYPGIIHNQINMSTKGITMKYPISEGTF